MRISSFSVFLFAALAACANEPTRQASLPVPAIGEPGNVAGMDAGRVRVAFGAPQFVRKDGQIEMWRYDGAGCKAFFFMYPNGASLAVRHVETMPHGPNNQGADSTCLQGLLARAKTASS